MDLTRRKGNRIGPSGRTAIVLFAGRMLALVGLTSNFARAADTADPAGIASKPADVELAIAAHGVLEKYCYRCHGVEFKRPGLDVLDRATLLRPKDAKEEPFIVPGQPEESPLWDAIDSGNMPPEKQAQPTADEKQTIRRWIEAGALFPAAARPQREFLGEDTLLKLIAKDLQNLRGNDRVFARYFSLAHLWNNPAVSDEQLRLYRAGLSKLLNSLSYEFRITMPRAVDADATVLAIDLRKYGWSPISHWLPLMAVYPFGLQRHSETAEEVYELTDCELPYLRVDWFLRNASRPPLYHTLLKLPENAAQLERDLAVDVRKNFEEDRLWRAGFSKSGVSGQNRMVERHDANHGAYWKSYDFGTNQDRGNLFRFPLGPPIEGLKRQIGVFQHDGGEIIFNLPNGLQAYFLCKSDDTRIDEGPQTIVNDPNQFAGTFSVVNGISCMGCHKQGMISFEDTVRANFADDTDQPVAVKVLRLYPEQQAMADMVQADRERFETAVAKATQSLLQPLPDDDKKLSDYPEPVTRSAKEYDRALRIEDVARELGLPTSAETAKRMKVPRADELATVIKFSDGLRRLGLSPLASGETLPRDVWEQVFQRTARELKLGVPLKVD